MTETIPGRASDAGEPAFSEDGPHSLYDYLSNAMDELHSASRLRDDDSVRQKRRQREAIDRARVWLQAADATLLTPGEAARNLGTFAGCEETSHHA